LISNRGCAAVDTIKAGPQFGHMPYEEAQKSVKLFAQEVLPVIHRMDAAFNPGALP
jgi:hypothetical protein